MPNSHPNAQLEGSAQWSVVDRALLELAQNHDLVETTSHEYIVGYLCKALAETPLPTPQPASTDARRDALANIRAAVRKANTTNRDLVDELIAERRLEAQHD